MFVNFVVIPIILFLILIRIGAFDNEHHVVSYTIKSKKIKKDVNIVLLTDHHGCYYGDEQEILIDDIEKIKPDIILYSGDIFDDRLPFDNTITLLKNLKGKYPAFYVTGNHEVRTEKLDEIKEILINNKIEILDGINKRVLLNDNKLLLGGLSDPELKLEQLNLLEKSNDLEFSILLSHRPELTEEYNDIGYDLVVTGHAHGGQWAIPKLLNGLYAPNQGIFPKYAGGIYNLKNTILIVSRGLAKESTKFVPRIFNKPEIVNIILEKE